MLELEPSEDYIFDPVAAERPILFIERLCIHFEGVHAGQPFLLHESQKRIIRDVYGWKYAANGARRFTQVWLEGAAGSGKSPLLAGLGLFGLVADSEPG